MLRGALIIEASYSVSSATRVDICFEKSSIVPDQLLKLFQKNYGVLLSIFNPEGWLEITYVDDTTRIGRDDKGNIFLLERTIKAISWYPLKGNTLLYVGGANLECLEDLTELCDLVYDISRATTTYVSQFRPHISWKGFLWLAAPSWFQVFARNASCSGVCKRPVLTVQDWDFGVAVFDWGTQVTI